jgi:hypothetical protein
MKELVLHIGHSKCASSSIQAFLSRNSMLGPERNYVYHCLMPGEKHIRGPAVTELAERLPARFVSSNIDLEDPRSFFDALHKIKRQGLDESVIISSEGLGNTWLDESRIAVLESLNVPVRILMLTRPPADWLNASWWQWGCWSGLTVEKWVNHLGRTINYAKRLEPWLALRNLESVHVADISQNPILQLHRFLEIAYSSTPAEMTANVATSADLLRFLINNKTVMNRSVHNPSVEFELNRVIDPSGGPPPFVLTQQMVRDAIERSCDDHATLLQRMHWKDGAPSPKVVSMYLDTASYDGAYADFDFDSFLKEELPAGFLRQINSWLIQKLDSVTGAAEGFDPESYLALNPDVALAGADPHQHYLRYGMKEGRPY